MPAAQADEVVYALGSLSSGLLRSPMDYSTLAPAGPTTGLPLLLWLHGADGSRDFLAETRPVFEQCWADGSLPPVVVATPSAARSFYLDRLDGTDQWESAILDELIPHLQDTTGVGTGAPVLVGGVSMGGMGSLRMAFKHPARFAAVAAVEPGVENTATWADVAARDRIFPRDEIFAAAFGDPVDQERYAQNHPLGLLERNAAAIVASGLGIYLEVGELDILHLQHGVEALHRRMFDLRVPHEYRLVRWADHTGATLAPRIADALGFLGRHLAGPPPVPIERELAAGFMAEGERASGFRRTVTVPVEGGALEVLVVGTGPLVVLIPSLGRGATDFAHLADALAVAGFTAAAPQPRGIGGSTAPVAAATLAELAADVAAVVAAVGGPGAQATVVGHAFGNRVARMTAATHPEVVRDVVLLACGGKVAPAPEHHDALLRVFDATLPPAGHLAAVRTAFFAPGHDADVWAEGWHAEVAAAQGAAARATPLDEWWTAGSAPVLIVQPEHDVVAVAANAADLLTALGDRGELVVMPDAGHALLPEQPDAVATTVLRWLRR